MNPISYRHALLAAVAVTAGGWAAAAAAQDRPRAAQDATGVEEVVVTAARRESVLQKLPMSVSAVTEDKLEDLRARATQDYILTVPGVSFFDAGGGRQSFTVRGVSTLGSGATTARYIDETPLSTDLRLFDIDRVEVLRGPQGTLYGVSAMGGAIRTITRKPDLNDFQLRFDGSALQAAHGGTGGDVNLAVNIPLVQDKLAVRVVAFDERRPGVIDNYAVSRSPGLPTTVGALVEKNTDAAEFKGGRLMARFAPSDELTVDATLYYQDTDYDSLGSEDLDLGKGRLRQGRRFNEAFGSNVVQGNLTVRRNLPIGELITSTTYLKGSTFTSRDTTDVFGPFLPVFNLVFGLGNGGDTSVISPLKLAENFTEKRFTQEVRLASHGGGRLNWVVGGFYTDGRTTGVQNIDGPNAAQVFGGLTPGDSLFEFDPEQPDREISVFGEVNYNLTSKLQATVGLRRYHITSSFDQQTKGLFNFDGTLASITTGTHDHGDASESGFTYKFLLSYQANDNLLIYGGASSGYRPGGPNASIPPGQVPTPVKQFTSDKLWQYEAGVKSSWWERRLIANLAVFDIEWSNIQTQIPTNGGFSFFANVGEAHSRGAELELQARPIEGLDLGAAVTYLDAAFETPFASLNVQPGDRLPNIPRLEANVNGRYSWPAFGGWRGFVQGSWSHVSGRVNNASQAIDMPGYERTDARLGIDGGDREISLFVANAFDERGVIGFETNLGYQRVQYIQPRVIGVSVRADF